MKNNILFWVFLVFALGCGSTNREKIKNSRALMQAGNFEDALIILDDVIANSSDNQAAYNMRGIAKLELGQADLAIHDFNISVTLDSGDYRAYYNRANAYYQIENYSQSILDYDNALKLEPKSADLYINRGNALVQLEKYKEALFDFKFALELDKNNYLTNFNLGRTYYLMDSLNLAQASFENTINAYPTFAPAFYFMGMISLEKEELDKSCLLFKKASELGYQQANEVRKIYCEDN